MTGDNSLTSGLLHPDWQATYDEDSGQVYYFNKKTRETTWEMPIAEPEPEVDDETSTQVQEEGSLAATVHEEISIADAGQQATRGEHEENAELTEVEKPVTAALNDTIETVDNEDSLANVGLGVDREEGEIAPADGHPPEAKPIDENVEDDVGGAQERSAPQGKGTEEASGNEEHIADVEESMTANDAEEKQAEDDGEQDVDEVEDSVEDQDVKEGLEGDEHEGEKDDDEDASPPPDPLSPDGHVHAGRKAPAPSPFVRVSLKHVLANPEKNSVKPVNTPRSTAACKLAGIDAEELVYRNLSFFKKPGVDEEIAQMRFEHFLKRWGKKMEDVQEAYERLKDNFVIEGEHSFLLGGSVKSGIVSENAISRERFRLEQFHEKTLKTFKKKAQREAFMAEEMRKFVRAKEQQLLQQEIEAEEKKRKQSERNERMRQQYLERKKQMKDIENQHVEMMGIIAKKRLEAEKVIEAEEERRKHESVKASSSEASIAMQKAEDVKSQLQREADARRAQMEEDDALRLLMLDKKREEREQARLEKRKKEEARIARVLDNRNRIQEEKEIAILSKLSQKYKGDEGSPVSKSPSNVVKWVPSQRFVEMASPDNTPLEEVRQRSEQEEAELRLRLEEKKKERLLELEKKKLRRESRMEDARRKVRLLEVERDKSAFLKMQKGNDMDMRSAAREQVEKERRHLLKKHKELSDALKSSIEEAKRKQQSGSEIENEGQTVVKSMRRAGEEALRRLQNHFVGPVGSTASFNDSSLTIGMASLSKTYPQMSIAMATGSNKSSFQDGRVSHDDPLDTTVPEEDIDDNNVVLELPTGPVSSGQAKEESQGSHHVQRDRPHKHHKKRSGAKTVAAVYGKAQSLSMTVYYANGHSPLAKSLKRRKDKGHGPTRPRKTKKNRSRNKDRNEDKGGDALVSALNFRERGKFVLDRDVMNSCLEYPGVQTIDLSHCLNITNSCLVTVSQYCKNLRSIDLSSSDKITGRGVVDVARGCPLSRLDISNLGRVSESHLKEMAINCRTLTVLNMSNLTGVKDTKGFEMVVRSNRNLTTLLMGNCNIEDSVLESAGMNLRNLVHLDISGCTRITDSGIVAVVQGCSKLRSIDVSGCLHLSDESVRAMCLSCPSLDNVHLAGLGRVTDSSIDVMRIHMSSLKTCDLTDCEGVSELSVRRLRAAFPSALIMSSEDPALPNPDE